MAIVHVTLCSAHDFHGYCKPSIASIACFRWVKHFASAEENPIRRRIQRKIQRKIERKRGSFRHVLRLEAANASE